MHYNTQRKSLPMPEYGRSVQEMIDYALTVEERAERQRCAEAIINIMGGMFPTLRDVPDFQGKLWDHLAYMSEYKLDIDYPFEITRLDNSRNIPERIAYSPGDIRFRHYGRIVQDLIHEAVKAEDPEMKSQLTKLTAIQMKKDLMVWNPELADDRRVAADMLLLSDGALTVSEEDMDSGIQVAHPQNQPRQFQQQKKNKNRRRY